MTLPYTFQGLLAPLEGTREAAKLAILSAQVKIEQAVLSEIMFNENRQFPALDFYLEEMRRDLTVRKRTSTDALGVLLDWVEAKMCYTDCLARTFTGYAKPFEFRDQLRNDVKKQEGMIRQDPDAYYGTRLTSLLFAIHHETPDRRHKYKLLKRRKRRSHSGSAIEEAAVAHVRHEFPSILGRELVEYFALTLEAGCRLHVFVFHDSGFRMSF